MWFYSFGIIDLKLSLEDLCIQGFIIETVNFTVMVFVKSEVSATLLHHSH